ncbi:MAG: helix-turn-helix domain-containing protein [Gemmatimonadaceae bacterium]
MSTSIAARPTDTTRLTAQRAVDSEMMPIFSRLAATEPGVRGEIEICADAARHIDRQALHWPGVLFETGRNYITSTESASLGHHYIGLNADPDPVILRGVGRARAVDVTLAPGAAWIVPAGDSITLRVEPRHRIVRMTIDPLHADAMLEETPGSGVRLELRRSCGIDAPQLRHLMMALAAEADPRGSTGLAFVETLIGAVTQQVAMHAGVTRPARTQARGGLSPRARRRVLEVIDAQLDARLSIETLAKEVGLSPAHFARAFKQTLGEAPHRFLMARRLERARHLIERCGAQLSDVAARSGFADQAHFTRHFKRQFGVTPGALTKMQGRCA